MKCFHVKRNFTFRKSPRAVLALGGLLEPGHVVGGGAVGGGGVAGGGGAQLAVVEGGELVPVCAHLLPVRQLLPPHRRLVALLLLVQEQLQVKLNYCLTSFEARRLVILCTYIFVCKADLYILILLVSPSVTPSLSARV